MQITLTQHEKIDSALSAFCAAQNAVDRGEDPRLEVKAENRLLDAIIDYVGYERASNIPDLAEWAASVVLRSMTGAIEVIDGEAV
jgi:hypothetical protein